MSTFFEQNHYFPDWRKRKTLIIVARLGVVLCCLSISLGLFSGLGSRLDLGYARAFQVQAQTTTPIDLAVGPPTTYLHLKPGTKSTHRLSIQQKGTLPLEITPSLVDFVSDGTSGQPILASESTFRYVTLSLPGDTNTQTNSFNLDPNQTKNSVLNFDIPAEAPEGEFPLTILFRAKPNQQYTVNPGNSEVNAVVGANIVVLISDSGQDKSNITLEKIESWKLVDSFMPISFTVLAKNSGSNASTASGSARITNWQNQPVATFPLYPDMILANSTRHLRTAPSLEAALQDPSLLSPQFAYRSLFLLGPYTIDVDLQQNTTNQRTDSSLTQVVIALPFSLVAILLLLLLSWRFFLFLSTKKLTQSNS
jgi:hypothetical protein